MQRLATLADICGRFNRVLEKCILFVSNHKNWIARSANGVFQDSERLCYIRSVLPIRYTAMGEENLYHSSQTVDFLGSFIRFLLLLLLCKRKYWSQSPLWWQYCVEHIALGVVQEVGDEVKVVPHYSIDDFVDTVVLYLGFDISVIFRHVVCLRYFTIMHCRVMLW